MKGLKRVALVALSALLGFVFLCGFAGCGDPAPVPEDFGPDLAALRAEGKYVVNEDDEKVLLQGTNAGGYLVLEGWMTVFGSSDRFASDYGAVDHKNMTEVFTDRFGRADTAALWEEYRKNYWTEEDFQNCAELGMNVIRLPFSYMSCDPEFNNVPEIPGRPYNFSVLEDFVNRAKKYGMYTILDMHGAYGSQNGKDHSGEVLDWEDVDFYSDEEKQQKTIALWTAIADHFKDNPNVAAYDILNEPGELNEQGNISLTTTRHFAFFDKAYDAIRSVDPNRMIIVESCWSGADLPQPSVYEWENVMYSFHHYTGGANHIPSMIDRVNEVNGREFNVPVLMGEFTCYNTASDWAPTLELFQENGWHWTTWTYKVYGNTAWGIYNTRPAAKVVPDADDDAPADTFNQIVEKFKTIRTDADTTVPYEFRGGEVLFDILQDAFTKDIASFDWFDDETL